MAPKAEEMADALTLLPDRRGRPVGIRAATAPRLSRPSEVASTVIWWRSRITAEHAAGAGVTPPSCWRRSPHGRLRVPVKFGAHALLPDHGDGWRAIPAPVRECQAGDSGWRANRCSRDLVHRRRATRVRGCADQWQARPPWARGYRLRLCSVEGDDVDRKTRSRMAGSLGG